jgi:hypothetical protein
MGNGSHGRALETLAWVSTQPQAATHWLVRDLFKLTAEASASHLSSYWHGSKS